MLYQDINTIITKLDPELSASESHGMAAGMLCVDSRTEPGFWLGELLHEGSDPEFDDNAILHDWFEEARGQMAIDSFDFELLLPDEDAPLSERLEALRQWCQGFLYGLGATTSIADSSGQWPDEIREIVKDITEFTKLDSAAEGEDAENDFMEINEYLRAAVIYLRSELNTPENRTVH
jgi:uncharacterized protein